MITGELFWKTSITRPKILSKLFFYKFPMLNSCKNDKNGVKNISILVKNMKLALLNLKSIILRNLPPNLSLSSAHRCIFKAYHGKFTFLFVNSLITITNTLAFILKIVQPKNVNFLNGLATPLPC